MAQFIDITNGMDGGCALAGIIGVIGLVVPHLLRLLGITDYQTLLPECALAGALI